MQTLKYLGISLVLIALLSATIVRGALIEPVGSRLRIVFGSVVLLFLPGWWITKAFFTKNEIDELETIALSFAFSISVVPLLVFYINLFGIKISEWLVIAVVILIILLCASRLLRKRKKEE